jgi:carbon monoxide dehydrogenase subunit G
MIVENAFTVDAPMDDVFDTLRDVRTVLPCIDARVSEVVDGHTARGEVTIPMGPMGDATMVFHGTLRVGDSDREAGAITWEARGTGADDATAHGTLAVRLRESNGSTTVAMHADVEISAADFQLRDAGGFVQRLGDEVQRRVRRVEPPAVRGTVRMMAPPVPLPADGPSNLPDAMVQGMRRRPWLIPAGLVALAAAAAVLRSRSAGDDLIAS